MTRMVRRRASLVLASALVVGGLLACGEIVGIEELSSEDDEGIEAGAPPRPDARPPSSALEASTLEGGETPATSKRVFVTSDRTSGMIGGVVGAEGRCAAAAGRAGLEGTWVPWLSGEGVNAIDRLRFDGPYVLLDGRTIASSKAQLASGNLTRAIDVTETGEKAAGDTRVWTGTGRDGKLFAVCSNWTTANPVDFGTLGSLDRPADGLWTDNRGPGAGFRNWGCQTTARLYCFEL